jgi:hypothetical protein
LASSPITEVAVFAIGVGLASLKEPWGFSSLQIAVCNTAKKARQIAASYWTHFRKKAKTKAQNSLDYL